MMFLKKSFWAMMSVYMCLWLVVVMIAGTVLDGYKSVINSTLGLSGYRTETITTEGEDLEYFKSKYVQYNEDGTIKYVTDENGYTHQVYDDVALHEAAIEKANQVQREGTTILWNSDDSGLPLEKGDNVSLFSRSTVDWVYSGGGSGHAQIGGTEATDMRTALKNAGLSVNDTLWNFYKSGAGKDYVRESRISMNEVPWSKYTDAVKNTFASYGDAAIIVFSRRAGEGSVAQGGAFDVTQTEADTPSGDYYDMSIQERTMLSEVIKLKQEGTFKKVIVLLNTPTDMWLAPLMEYKDNIDCCMWVGQTGAQGLSEVGKILVGVSIPSGHLVDTFLMNTQSNPAFANSIASMYTNAKSYETMFLNKVFQAMYVTYAEGIYVGYKYYETRYEDAVMGQGNATSTAGAVNSSGDWKYSEEVAFPFGHGGSYTTFAYSNYEVTVNADGDYVVTLTVKNTGSKKGADAVQIYAQKPYTNYDKMWGIEEAAVNLVGYAKTAELAPGDSVDVTITVRDDAFKTYDAYNKKTYIREKSEGINAYYLTAAQDAHEAVNNILAAKGYTPENTNGVMDAAGNADLVKRYDFDTDDFETFSVSEITGNAITNQFDGADWNSYENKTDGEIVFLSRRNWQATYPLTTTKLTMNEAMVEDTDWNDVIVADPDDVSPTYGQTHVFNLVDMRGKSFNDPLWDTLLNQLTLDEMIGVVARGDHGTGTVESIAKPRESTQDGPLGVRQKYQTNSTLYTLSFPSTVLLAASYNDQLAVEVGELMGEDMLHTGITGIYAPGANIHRSTYSGRNYEYYSEDGFLTGMMTRNQVAGIQSKGCYVNLKHIVLNDQETNRHGLNTWATEQAIREIYLAGFEFAITEADCTGLMSGFNRIGTTWNGAHKGLMTNVLRGEWGFEGFVISDAGWRVFMDVEDGLLAGNDCPLGDIDLSNYSQVKGNATLENAVRQSTHRILYVVANSNAMNGFSSNTKVYEVREWWQELVTNIQIGVAIATGIVIIITILMFIFGKSGYEFGGGNIVSAIICIVLSVAILGTSLVVPIALAQEPLDMSALLGGETSGEGENGKGGTTDGDEGGGENGGETPAEPSLKDELEGELTDYYFEAECATLEAANETVGAGLESGRTVAGANYPSGGGYVYNLSKSGDAKLTFNVTASADGKAVLSLRMGRSGERKLSDMFKITVNGTEVSFDSSITFTAYETIAYFDWLELEVAIVDLKAGDNTIVFTKQTTGLNFDRMTLSSALDLQFTSEVNVGHTYGDWELIEEPTSAESGTICSYCKTCRNYLSEEIPAISETNGYTKTVITPVTATTFGKATFTYTKDNTSFSFDITLYPEGAKALRYEAEATDYTGAQLYRDLAVDASAGAYLGKVNKTQWSMTLEIQSDRDCQAILIINVSRRNDYSFNLNNLTLTVNGTNVTIPSDAVVTPVNSLNAYYNWDEVEMAVIDLKEGKNVITVANNGKAFNNIDYYSIVSVGEISKFSEI